MGYTPAPAGSRLFLDFTRDQFCEKVLDRSGMCGEPAVLGGVTPIWKPDGLQFASSNCVLKNNSNIDIVSASPQKPVIWWFDMQLKNPTSYGWFFRKAFESNSIPSQYGAYMATDQYIQVRVNASSASIDIVSPVFRRKERFFLSVFWNGEKIYGYINGKLLAQNTLVTTIPSGGDLTIGMKDPAEAGEIIIDGSEVYVSYLDTGNHYSYVTSILTEAKTDGYFVEENTDKPYTKLTSTSQDTRGIRITSDTSVRITIEKSKVDTMEGSDILARFKAYLNQCPILLKYELSTFPAYFNGLVAQCGITVGASIAELHEWHRKYKTGNLQNTSIVAMQSETLPDGALDSTIMLKR
jgi:hypothetical protein